MQREGSEEEEETEPLFQTTEFHLNLNTTSFYIKTGIQWAAWGNNTPIPSPRSYAVKHLNN